MRPLQEGKAPRTGLALHRNGGGNWSASSRHMRLPSPQRGKGGVIRGVSMREMGQRIFDLILRVASGEKSKSEELGFGDNEFTPWQIGATI